MEKNKTLQEVYKNSSEEVKEILKTKFSNNDLGIVDVEKQIRDEILEIIKKNIKNIQFLNENGGKSDLPTQRFEILDEVGNWLFDINYDKNNKHFYYYYYGMHEKFKSKYDTNCQDFKEIMVGVVEDDLNMIGVTPRSPHPSQRCKVEDDLNEVREILKSKFSYSDLGIINVEQEIRNGVLGLIKNNIKNVRFLNKNGGISDLPTNRVEILDENGSWLFDINHDKENKHFLYSYYGIFEIFRSKYGINIGDFNNIMKGVVGGDLKMDEVTTTSRWV